ncbi:MAG TPA: SPOR domain-containing protein [Dissulfurispiraceae bacterium]|nr:SPOR domain-containing protein [Dissulfurispiraceae bacterium]
MMRGVLLYLMPSFHRLAARAALAALLCLCAGVSYADNVYYSVQTGSFKTREFAERQYNLLKKNLSPQDLDQLRIEEYQEFHCVRVGRFPKRADAAAVLGRVRALVPQAYVARISIAEERAPQVPRKEPASEIAKPEVKPPPIQPEQKPPQAQPEQKRPAQPAEKPPEKKPAEKKDRKPLTGKIERKPDTAIQEATLLKGKVIQTAAIAPNLIGVTAEGAVYRVILSIEETKEVAGKLDLLKGRKGETLTFFSGESITSDLAGKRIEARAEYLGDERGKLFWLKDIKVIE